MQKSIMQKHSLRILCTFLEYEKSKDESPNYELFLKCMIKIKDIVTNITNLQFNQTLVRISELKNSSIDSLLLSENYKRVVK